MNEKSPRLANLRKLGFCLLALVSLTACSTYRDCRSENIPRGQCVFVTVFESIEP